MELEWFQRLTRRRAAQGLRTRDWTARSAAALGLLVYAALTALRKPDSFLNAQFWAEDGSVFYAQAHARGGIRMLLVPYGGYLHFVPRVTAMVAQLVPLRLAPLLFNLAGVAFQLLPVVLLFSSRLDSVMPRRQVRVVLAVIYLILPNSREVYVAIIHAQIHLMLAVFLVLLMDPPRHPLDRAMDVGLVGIQALTGPFCLFLLPVAVVWWLSCRQRWTLLLAGALAAGAVVQGVALVQAHRVPGGANMGATMPNLVHLLAGQLVVASLLGRTGYAWLYALPAWRGTLLTGPLLAGAIAILAYAAWRGGSALRLLLLLGGLGLAAALTTTGPPSVGTGPPISLWQGMAIPDTDTRYFLVPMLAWLGALLWLALSHRPAILRGVGTALFAIFLLVGARQDFTHTAFGEHGFSAAAARFKVAPVGTVTTFALEPAPWTMTLTRNPARPWFARILGL